MAVPARCLLVFALAVTLSSVLHATSSDEPAQPVAAGAGGEPVPTAAREPESRSGDYGQPRWAIHQPFASADVYVLPKGASRLGYRQRLGRPDAGSGLERDYAAAFGLPGRFQLELSGVGHRESGARPSLIDAQRLGVRWALANWGTIWGNPAIETTWEEASIGANVAGLGVLLGGQLAVRWHWSSNVAWQRETAGARSARGLTGGLSYSISNGVAVGLEGEVADTTTRLPAESPSTRRGRRTLLGPALQLLPLRHVHIDIAPLVAIDGGSRRAEVSIAAGWQF